MCMCMRFVYVFVCECACELVKKGLYRGGVSVYMLVKRGCAGEVGS